MTQVAEVLIVVGIVGVLLGGADMIMSSPYRKHPFYGMYAMFGGLLLILLGTVVDPPAIYLVLPLPK